MNDVDQGPSRVWYWVGAGIAVVGVIGAVLWFVLGMLSFAHQIDGFQRVPVDGEPHRVTLLRTGSYTAYHEAPGGNEAAASDGIEAELVSSEGRSVRLAEYDTTLTYDVGGNAGRAVFTFEIDTPGSYELRASSTEGGELALGRGVGGKLVRSLVGGFVIGFLAVALGAPVVIVTAVRRQSARRRQPNPVRYPPPTAGS